MNAQGLLIEAAEAKPDSEAAAWLGILYLFFLDVGETEADVPMWFKTQTMVKLLEAAGGESSTGDADYVLGHMCSDGLAGFPKSLEAASEHYYNGARRGHIGCVSDAVLRGVDLKGKLTKEWHNKALLFTESQKPEARVHARQAYALAALTSSFQGVEENAAGKDQAIGFLQANVEADLAKGVKTDRQFDLITICFGAMLREAPLEVKPWVEDRVDNLAKAVYSEEPDGRIPHRSFPTWLLLANFDAELAKGILVAGAGSGAEGADADALVGQFLAGLDPADYADAPFVWSFIEPVIAALEKR